MNIYKLFLFTAGLLLGVASLAGGEPSLEAASVVIVVNANDPDSIAIGEFYAQQRGIPQANIIALETSAAETISVRDYVDTIANPLLAALIEKKWVQGVLSSERDHYGRLRMSVALNSISYLVTVRGVPLRIENDPQLLEAGTESLPPQFRVNNASVDSELALLLAPANTTMTALVPNPFLQQLNPSQTDRARILRVSRLDGPSIESVSRLIERSLEAEENGLKGRAYIDTGGPHVKGDEWIAAAGELAKAAYFDVDLESSKRLMGFEDRYDAPAIYMGWYRASAYGPWRQKKWAVPAGAIAFHLHSFSAVTVRSPQTGWLGTFVNQGYCATVGNVYEPYLEYTHRPQLLLQHLLQGHTFGEAVFFANPSLSWQGVAIGDPLYRPFAVSLDAQLQQVKSGGFSSYVTLREINRIEAAAGRAAALVFARSAFLEHPTLALAYRLAVLYRAEQRSQEAVAALRLIRYIAAFGMDEQILVKQIADLLNELGATDAALETYQKLIEQPALPKPLRIALLRGGAPVAAAAGRFALESAWSLEAQKLELPSVPKPK